MPSFAVRCKGVLFKTHLERLRNAGIELKASTPALQAGMIKFGQPINTLLVEAGSEEAAVAKTMEALAPDDVNFSGWEAGREG